MHINITVCIALLVCVASAFIEPSLHQLDFFLGIFYRDLFLFFFDCRCSTIVSVLHVLPTHSWLILLVRVPMDGVQQLVHSAPSVFSQKSAGGISLGYAQNEAQMDHGPGNFLTVGGYFKHYTYCVTVLGKLKKEEDERFLLSTVSGCHFK